MANSSTYDLGPLVGNSWYQYSNAAGQIYYYHHTTRETTYSIPAGWEDAAGDLWVRDVTKTWPQWNNQRTRRARLDDPNPPPPQTYLEDPRVQARLSVVQRHPDSAEYLYRRVMSEILQWLFTRQEGFTVVQEDSAGDLRPDFSVLKLLCRPGGSNYEYEFLLAESKKLGEPWGSTEDHLETACENNDNDTKNVYAMIQIGLVVQFYKFESRRFQKLGGTMDLVNQVQAVIQCANYMKSNPMPVI
ncbi:hypothetical protein B0J14DRAFT_606071 [Halenospora varia]|nr:hypothetical protein B0J14DRAFT_606071 [Halenospora varia]